ncbi:MAG: AraC family transcriptional regulator [Roseibium sp.]|uniref:AraC family transcriptional regulator n=1 Tax=Roseibium sp. TaxID=1936156 RepID=UPI00262E7979|nr:AraC family transcriptional regulator [Roseibium sp.]MCV0427403.1 AraC family transcriptional regulator [Roseibium sp.]
MRTRDVTPGLERSCADDWVRAAPWQQGIQRIEAFFSGEAYAPHRHDTYAIGFTIRGVQSFDYRGSRADSTSGRIIVLHPDEVHNGEAGSEEGFHYRMMYIEPSLVRDALVSSTLALPFVKDAVLDDPKLMQAIQAAFSDMDTQLEQIALDEIAGLLADGLLANDKSVNRASTSLIDVNAIDRAREYLDANYDSTVASSQLEVITGQDRFSLARQFRKALGTSPYRYLMMRRLDRARAKIATGFSLTDAALATGFSDQSHMTRCFKASYGISPGHWQRLVSHTV